MTAFSLNADRYASEGLVRITWTGTTSANHYSFRVYRKSEASGTWELIRERVDLANSYSYEDYSAPAGFVQYTVVEVTISGNQQVEETYAPRSVTLETPYYWLIHPTDQARNIQLRNISGDDFKMEREVEIKHLIGRGRKVDVGDELGLSGSLTGRIYDRPGQTARQTRKLIEAAKDENTYYFLRNPFGDMLKIWFDDPQFGRIPGVGQSEFVEMSFNYYQVA